MTIPRKIGFFGAGDVAQTVGRVLQAAGHDVRLSSRRPDPEKTGFPTGSFEEAAAFGDVLINATPGELSIDILTPLPAETLKGKTLLDISVGLAADMGSVTFPEVSGAEQLQAALPVAHVVKSLCTMTSTIMANPGLLDEPTTVFVSGDDSNAKGEVKRLLDDLGWPTASQLDLGGLRTARGQEQFAMMYFALVETLGTGNFNVAVHVEHS